MTVEPDKLLAQPDPLAHVELVRLRDDWLAVFPFAAFALAVGAAFSYAAWQQQWYASFLIFFAVIVLAASAVIVRASLTYEAGSRKISERFTVWSENQKQLRANSSARIEQDQRAITLKAGATATFGGDVNQVNITESAVKSLTTALTYQREFRQRIDNIRKQYPDATGVELKWWLEGYGAPSDYLFEDGTRMTQTKHTLLAQSLKPLGEYPAGRVQGARGKPIGEFKIIGGESE